uniref:Uncharacterized protein n=1 Tax=Opuntia streptacantha TaxID=393608 RepID=A0A7C9EY96_OPUST
MTSCLAKLPNSIEVSRQVQECELKHLDPECQLMALDAGCCVETASFRLCHAWRVGLILPLHNLWLLQGLVWKRLGHQLCYSRKNKKGHRLNVCCVPISSSVKGSKLSFSIVE